MTIGSAPTVPTVPSTVPTPHLASYLDKIIGQERAKKLIIKSAESSIQRSTKIPHMLFSGPPGTGKTVICLCLADMLGLEMVQLDASVIVNSRDLAFRLAGKPKDGVLIFIDEIHALNSKTQETVYRLMDGEGISYTYLRQVITIDFNPVVIGATTNPGRLSEPLRDRIGLDIKLEPYSEPEIIKIIEQYLLDSKKIDMATLMSLAIAQRSKRVPRLAKRLADRWYEWVNTQMPVEEQLTTLYEVCDLLGIDHIGLREEDRDYLYVLMQADGEPMGLRVLEQKLHAGSNTIEQIIEPYLNRIEFISQTPRGRVITEKGLMHLARWESRSGVSKL